MQHAPPTNDKQRTTFLEVLTREADQDRTDGVELLPEELIIRAENLKQSFRAAQNAARERLTRRRATVEAKNRAIDQLDRMNRDFWEVLKRRNRREGHSETVLDQYRLTSETGPPHTNRANEILVTGQLIIEGERKAIEAGIPPMTNPSADELEAQLEITETAQKEATKAERDYQTEQQALEGLRTEVRDLLESTRHYFHYRLEGSTPARQRATMTRYGFTFTGNRGEIEEIEPETEEEPETQTAE